MVLDPSAYDGRYFHGAAHDYTHNAGYTRYRNWTRSSTDFVPTLDDSTGTYFGDLAKGLNLRHNIIGKDVLVIGCAYGYLVEFMRSLGINAEGVDVSGYAISQADIALAPYLTVADIRTHISTYRRNEWDYIVSRWFLECMSDTDLAALIPEMNRVSRNQLHIINSTLDTQWYNTKTLAQWQALAFETGTILIDRNDIDNYVTVI